MKIKLDNRFHDSEIISVFEDCEMKTLTILINFPTNWEENVFEKKKLIFEDVFYYKSKEIPFIGKPTILSINEIKKNQIEINTNAGKKIISFKNFKLTSVF